MTRNARRAQSLHLWTTTMKRHPVSLSLERPRTYKNGLMPEHAPHLPCKYPLRQLPLRHLEPHLSSPPPFAVNGAADKTGHQSHGKHRGIDTSLSLGGPGDTGRAYACP